MERQIKALFKIVKQRIGKVIDEEEISLINDEMKKEGFDVNVTISFPYYYGDSIEDGAFSQGWFSFGFLSIPSLFESVGETTKENGWLSSKLISVSYWDEEQEKMVEVLSTTLK